VISKLAARRFGVVSRRELLAVGLTRNHIDSRVAAGHLHSLHRGVYAVGHRELRVEGHWWAAVLAGGPASALSHRACAESFRIPGLRFDRIEITVPVGRGNAWTTVLAHRARLARPDITIWRGIPTTTPARLALDLAEVLEDDEHLDRALDEMIRLRLYNPRAVDAVVERSPGRRGIKRLQHARRRLHANSGRTRSELERVALKLLAAHELPPPVVNRHRHGYRVDLQWAARRVVVEVDGYDFHRTPFAFADDHARDNDLLDAGWRVRRFTWDDVVHDGPRTAMRIAAMLGIGA
jgi:very-short-patch-repair endonuclease